MKLARELREAYRAAGVQSAEAFLAILKRGVFGTFHSVSEQHICSVT